MNKQKGKRVWTTYETGKTILTMTEDELLTGA
jgi:hypothetical protein